MGITSPGVISDKTQPVPTKKEFKNRPAIDLGDCNQCEGCIEVAPTIFRFNKDNGYLEVCELDYYESELVDEAIKNCPMDCICWDDP